MKGRRIYSDGLGGYFADAAKTAVLGTISAVQPGDYWQEEYGWNCMVPTGAVGNLKGHKIVEHEDGTITVSPSILLTHGSSKERNWHGYLEHGVWRTV